MPHHALPLDPILGLIGGTASAVTLWMADHVADGTNLPNYVIEAGGTIGLIGFLSYGCVTLWKQLQSEKTEAIKERDRHHLEIANLHAEILGETRRQNNELISVLNKLDPDKNGRV
jgi:hypothetical protein